MRTAGLPTFRKLWGRIDGNLVAGQYYLIVENNYDISYISGSKMFVMATINSLGG